MHLSHISNKDIDLDRDFFWQVTSTIVCIRDSHHASG